MTDFEQLKHTKDGLLSFNSFLSTSKDKDVSLWFAQQDISNPGQNGKAEEIYENLLDKTVQETEKASIYHQLGLIKYNPGEYGEAISFYEKSLSSHEKALVIQQHWRSI
ncbi:unnamed protein product [Adineta steineri]|uniref:Tetratricopeptide repeat protein n=1 Tax=Adineta steineri TaxID=433720 RepID=A0A814XDU6_9BILA|nr:unnamed protein product [Adineta steineri]CAF1383258.1 unnamed protein product [Adineta steineri]CAF4072984.1 unnamed protein product [Adineta steineri]